MSGWPCVVVLHPFVERRADAVHDAAEHLALDHHRIDHAPAVVHHDIARDRDMAGADIDLDLADMAAVGVGHRVGLEVDGGGKPRRHVAGQRKARHAARAHGRSRSAISAGRARPSPAPRHRRVRDRRARLPASRLRPASPSRRPLRRRDAPHCRRSPPGGWQRRRGRAARRRCRRRSRRWPPARRRARRRQAAPAWS